MAITLLIGEAKILEIQTYTEMEAGGATSRKTTTPTATWGTSDAGKVSVSTAGPSRTCTATGVAAGTATITATVGALTATVDYLVKAANAPTILFLTGQ